MKLNLKNPITWNWPRKEWRYVIDLLKPYHSDNGIIVDGFVDATFGYMESESITNTTIPYKRKWIGFWHHPPKIAPWIDKGNYAPECIMCKESFQASLPKCYGIFTFSNYLAKYLSDHLDVPVESLFHPTRSCEVKFDFNVFRKSKRIVQVGSWLRILSSFYCFEAKGYQKIHLLGPGHLEDELKHIPGRNIDMSNVQFLQYLNDDEYNALLSNSIVFVDLYDSSVNNTIIECIVRNTPILVNRIEPVIEYLGKDYPLYYDHISDIPDLVKNTNLIYDTHIYLQNHIVKRKLTSAYFIESILDSEIMNPDIYSDRDLVY